jgi:inosine-uridine nucleoside N-ribohydrolase
MLARPVLLLVVVCSLTASAIPALGASKGPTPVILDTDIGDDIDDTFALLMLLRSKELDLKLVVTDFGDTVYRARLAAKLLQAMGRPDVPVGVGLRQNEKSGAQAEWLGDYALSSYPGRVYADGVQAMIDTVMSAKAPVTLIAIGPAPNLEVALSREPRLAEHVRFVGMYGSLHRGYAGAAHPDAEWNVKSAIASFRRALEAPWPMLLTPLDTCALVHLDPVRWARVRASSDPAVLALVENNRLWCKARPDICGSDPARALRDTTVLYDTVAVYLAFAQDLVRVEETGVVVDDRGMTIPAHDHPKRRWAVEWTDLAAYEDLLVERLIGAGRVSKASARSTR